MWIIPSNLSVSFQCAPVCGGSKEELNELALMYEQNAMWKSKPLSAKIWLNKWSRVYWLPHLFSRTLKNSMAGRFVEEYTASLQDGLVSHFPLQAKGGAR